MRAMTGRIEDFTTWAGLQFNVAKCASLSMGYCDGKRLVVPSKFRLAGRVIPVMTWDDRYKHLGVLLGPDPEACIGGLTKEFRANTEKLFQCGLADWMKLEAFNEFLMPKLDFVLRSILVHKNWAEKLDRFIRSTVKRSLSLPVSACSAVFYVPSSQGGLGLHSVEDDLGSLMIT